MLNRRDECLKRWSTSCVVLAFALAAAFVTISLPVHTAFAQVTTATILGNVVDPGGAAVPGAAVTVTNTSTGAQVKATTGSDGSYIVPDLSISGLYTVTIGAPSFRTFEQKGIVLQVNQNARVDASLQLGATTQTVEVTGQPPQVDTASTALGEVITHEQVSELPLNGRNPTQLVTLAAGVTTASTPAVLAWRAGSYWSSNGTRADENAILLNGALYEGAYFNNGLNLPSPDALEEFKLITNTYSAEYGRNAGSVLNAVVKSGTNRFHGDAWEFWRNNDLNARNFFLNQPGAQVAKLNQNQFGVTAGGPIIKNKFFIFGGYQGLRIAQNSTNSGFLPTPNELAGYFTEPGGQVVNNPATGMPFPSAGAGYPANTYYINPANYNPIALNIVSKWLQPSGVNPTTGFITTLGSAPTTNNQILLKGDYNINSSNKLNFMWMRDRTQETSPFFGGTVPTYDTETPYTHITLYTLNDTETIRANLLNEFRASYTRLLDVLGCNKQFYANTLGINYTPDGAPENPDFSVSGYFGLSSIGLCNLSEGTPTREVNDTVSWVKGKHEFKFGGQWFKNTNVIFAAYLAEGNFNFNGSYTNNALADFLLGDVSLYQRQTEGDGALISNEAAAFAEDNWKVSRKVTLNLGLRYFVQQPWYATAGGIAFTAHGGDGQWDPGFETKKFQNAPPDILFPGDIGPNGRIPRGMYDTRFNMFEPRVGVAWDPFGDGKTSVRASYGVFHDIVVVDAIAQAGSVQPYIYREKFNDPVGGLTNPYLNEPDPWPYTAYLNPNPSFVLPATAAALDGNTQNPFIQGWTLDIQHQVTSNWMVEAAYVGKVIDHMIVDMDANSPIFVPGTGPGGVALSTLQNENQRRPYFGDGWETISNVGSWGRGSYHGLELSTQYRVRHGLFFQAGYTFSHGIDTNSNYNVGASNQIQDSYCLACEKGNSDNDRRNVFVASWIYNLPTPFSDAKGGQGMVGRNVLGHWEFSGIVRLTSGAPFTCEEGADRSLTGDGNDRCTITGNWSLPGGRSHGSEVNEWFNTSAFALTPLGNFGNSGRNQLTGPWQKNADLAILRNFPISERFGTVQFRAEFFNAFNLVNFNNPNNTFSSVGFGQITSAGSPRLIQLALKYDW